MRTYTHAYIHERQSQLIESLRMSKLIESLRMSDRESKDEQNTTRESRKEKNEKST